MKCFLRKNYIALTILLGYISLFSCTVNYAEESAKPSLDEKNYLNLSKNPYQYYIAPGKMVITVELPQGKSGTLSYWPKLFPDQKKTVIVDESWDRHHHKAYFDVDPSIEYIAQILFDGEKTKPLPLIPEVQRGENFTFLVAGDSRSPGIVNQQKIIDQMMKEEASVYVHLGDMVTYGDSVTEWDRFFRLQTPLLEKMLFFPVIGNHDVAWGNIFNRLFRPNDKYVTPPRYYAVTSGDAYFIILDTTIKIHPGDMQFDFLVSELEKAKQENFSYIFLFSHHPAQSSGWHGVNNSMQNVVVPLAEQYGVKAMFAGHDHHYERTHKINGVTYFVSGGAGSILREVEENKHTAFAKRVFHYLRISVRDEGINIKAIDENGRVIDEVEL